jgi:multidrug efflux pump
MLAATFLAIFFIPLFYRAIVDRRLRDSRSTQEIEAEAAHHRESTRRAAHLPPHHRPHPAGGADAT